MKKVILFLGGFAFVSSGVAQAITTWNGERVFTNETAVTIGTKLSGSQGLAKWGAGDLTITGVDHDYTGDVLLAGGTTTLTKANDVKDVRTGALGNPRVARTLMVTNGAALTIKGANAIGGGGTSDTPVLSDLHVVDATINFQTNFSCNLGDVYFHNATVTYYDGYQTSWRHWGTLLCRNLFFSGTNTYTFPLRGGDNCQNNCGLLIGKWAPERMGEIRVPDLSGDAATDVNFGWNLFCCIDSANTTDGCIGSFRKTGAGTLELSCNQNNFRGNIRVEEGTLKTSVGAAVLNATRTSLGNTQVAHTNYFLPGTTLWLASSDQQGQYYNNSKIVTIIKGATLKANDYTSNQMGPVILEDATLSYHGRAANTYYWATKHGDGTWTTNGPAFTSPWPTFGFHGGLTVRGTQPLVLPNRNTSALGFGANGMSDIMVEDITGNAAADLTIGMAVIDAGSWYIHNQCRVVGTNKLAVATAFRKTGPGTLLFNDATRNSTFSGPVEVAQGVLSINRADSNWGRFYTDDSPLGNTRLPHTITVHSGGVLEFASADIMGQLSKHCPGPSLVVSNGTLRLNAGCCNGLPNLKFFNGTFTYVSGSLGARQWGLFGFGGVAEFGGDNGAAYVLPNGSANNWVSLGYGTDLSIATNAAGTAVLYKGCTDVRVHDVTGDGAVDVTIHPVLQDLPDWPTRTDNDTVVGKGRPVYFSCGLRKTGAGTLRVTNNNTYTGATEVVEGTLLVDSASSRSPVTVKAGGRLGGVGRVPSVVVEPGGGFTAAPGQTGALTVVGPLTLPANREVGIDIATVGNLEDVQSIRVPVVASAGFEGVTWRGTLNGAMPPKGYKVSAVISGGVVYGVYARSGCTVFIR